jgi:class 3 adenylate cyclase
MHLLRFAEYLGQHQEARSRPPAELAREFDLSESLIRETLAYLEEIAQPPPEKRTRSLSPRRLFLWFFRLIEARPLATSAMATFAFFMMYRYYHSYAAGSTDALAMLCLLFALGTLVAVNFLRGQLRYALMTSALAVGAGLASVTVLNAMLGDGTALAWPNFIENAFNAMRSMLVLIGFFSLAAVMGAFYRHNRLAEAETKLDRLDMLKRTVHLRERLTMPSIAARSELRYRTLLRKFRSRWMLFAAGVGAGLFGVRLLTGITVGFPGHFPTTLQVSVYLLTLILVMGAYPIVGFVSGAPRSGLFAGLITFLVLAAGREWLTPSQLTNSALVSLDTFPWAGYAFPLGMLMAWVGGAGAKVHEQHDKERMIEASDQAAVLSEIARLSHALGMATAEVTCMVVDIVHSTRMKREANPLAVEISFREYTSFVRREVSRKGGAVRSVAGDGIVAEFESPEAAFAAARQIQTLMPEFNRTANTLSMPFRLRIGLHSGEVHGDLAQVSFAEVIDVAAHIEKESPAGGIIVTEPVRVALPEEDFVELANTMDGQRLFIAQQPTED